MFDNRNIAFKLTDVKPEIKLWRKLRKTDWTGYEEELRDKVKKFLVRLSTGCKIEHLQTPCENNCILS